MIVLAIESSCDETGVGIADLGAHGAVTLLADEVASSVDEHARFGGVVPEIASRAHLEALGPTMRRALDTAGVDKPDVVAATIGPGLAGALLVGVAAAKAYSAAWQVPFYAVNHLGGHLAADVFDHGPLPESVGLLVSGGHTNLLHVRSLGEPIVELGSTVDDAAGEAYDKVARLLGLGYPGGRVLDELARQGDRDAIVFPRGMTGPRDDPYAFSFSGLKTAVARYVESHPQAAQADVAAGFQEAVADVLTAKAVRAAEQLEVSTLLIAGGVAANSRLRELAEQRCAAAGLTLRVPRPRLCTDNGAMIASFAAHLIAAGAPPSRAGRRQRPGPAGGAGAGRVSDLADKLAVTELLYRYAESIDAGDFDGVGALLGRGSFMGVTGADRIAALFASTTRRFPGHRNSPRTRHLVLNPIVEVHGDTASARSTFCVVQQTDTVALQPIVVGRYRDAFARDAGGWHFTERTVDVEMIGDVSDHLMMDPRGLTGNGGGSSP